MDNDFLYIMNVSFTSVQCKFTLQKVWTAKSFNALILFQIATTFNTKYHLVVSKYGNCNTEVKGTFLSKLKIQQFLYWSIRVYCLILLLNPESRTSEQGIHLFVFHFLSFLPLSTKVSNLYSGMYTLIIEFALLTFYCPF